jgi:hypothetical protein
VSHRPVHIERKEYDPEGAAGALRAALLAGGFVGQALTVADAGAHSGLPLRDVEPALLAMSSEFPSRVELDTDGQLRFTFDSLEHPRRARRVPPLLERLARSVGKVFVPTVVLFTLVLSSPLLITLGANNFAMMVVVGTHLPGILASPFFLLGFFPAAGGFVWLSLMVLMLTPALFLLTGLGLLGVAFSDPKPAGLAFGLIVGVPMVLLSGRYVWEQLRELPAALRSNESASLGFWREVAGFIFGPAPRFADPLEDERRLMALIRRNKGVLCAGDLMSLFGWDARTANTELTRILVDYSGDIAITDEGIVLYRFESLASAREASRTWGLILLVSGAAGLALHPDLVFLPGVQDYRDLSDLILFDNTSFVVLEGAGGLIYVITLGIPLLRMPWWLWTMHRYSQRQTELERISREVQESRASELAVAEGARKEGGWSELWEEL